MFPHILLRKFFTQHNCRSTILETYRNHPDRALMESFPGAGPALEPRLIVAVGSRRERFESPTSMACFSGIAPVKEASGNVLWIHWRWACPKFIRIFFRCWRDRVPYSEERYLQAFAEACSETGPSSGRNGVEILCRLFQTFGTFLLTEQLRCLTGCPLGPARYVASF